MPDFTLRSLICLTLTATLATPSAADPAASNAAPEVNVERVRAHLDFLADNLLEGRETGSSGYDIAAAYLSAHFRHLGVEPAGTDGYLQPIEFVRTERKPGSAALVLHHGDEATELTWGDDFVDSPGPFAERTQITAAAVFVGYGIHAPEEGIDDFAGLDLEGKIAVVLSGAPKSLPNEKRAHYSSSGTKRKALIDRGAVGSLRIRTRTDAKRYDWQRVIDRAGQPNMVWRRGDTYPDDIDPRFAARARLSEAGARKLFEHAPVDLDATLDAAEEGPVEGFAFDGLKITVAYANDNSVITSPNVVAVLRGSDPELADEFVVYSGHLDHLGRGKAVNGDDIYNGYYDNAMGIALMLEAAEVLATASEPPARSILFLAVTGEEHGLLGSEYFARYPTVPLESIVANVNIDMPLLMYPLADLNAFGAEHSTLGAVVERAAARVGLTLTPDPMPEEVLFVRSDQYSFVQQGIPAVYLKPGFNSSDPEVDGGGVTGLFRKLHYHRPSDEIGLPSDNSAIEVFAQVNVLIGRAIANAPERPRWNESDFFGELFSP